MSKIVQTIFVTKITTFEHKIFPNYNKTDTGFRVCGAEIVIENERESSSKEKGIKIPKTTTHVIWLQTTKNLSQRKNHINTKILSKIGRHPRHSTSRRTPNSLRKSFRCHRR